MLNHTFLVRQIFWSQSPLLWNSYRVDASRDRVYSDIFQSIQPVITACLSVHTLYLIPVSSNLSAASDILLWIQQRPRDGSRCLSGTWNRVRPQLFLCPKVSEEFNVLSCSKVSRGTQLSRWAPHITGREPEEYRSITGIDQRWEMNGPSLWYHLSSQPATNTSHPTEWVLVAFWTRLFNTHPHLEQ